MLRKEAEMVSEYLRDNINSSSRNHIYCLVHSHFPAVVSSHRSLPLPDLAMNTLMEIVRNILQYMFHRALSDMYLQPDLATEQGSSIG